MAKNGWNTIPLNLNGPLDTRSRPADLGPGALRWKTNFAINSSGKLSRRTGHAALSFGPRSDTPAAVANWDFHRRGATREPVTLLSEITSPERLRYLFAGTESTLAWMDNGTSEWTTIASGMGADQARWKAAGLRDKVVFTNNVDQPQIHTLGFASVAPIPELAGQGISKAKVVVQYQNVIVLMNLTAQEYTITPDFPNPPIYTPTGPQTRMTNRIQWSDFRDATKWDLGAADTIAGFQDLDDGEEILNAVELAGVLWVFTTKSIWQVFPRVTEDTVFGFRRWYSEPMTGSACLKYENAVVSTGKEIFWAGRESIFWANQYSTAPSAPDWILRASGKMFEGTERIDPAFCAAPVAAFVPDATGASREVWFSYPRLGGDDGINDMCLVLSFNTDSTLSPWQTADYCDESFTAFCHFSHSAGIEDCSTVATFVAASGVDFCLKAVGGVFYRENVTLIGGDPSHDIPDASYSTTQTGYFSELRGMFPLPPMATREKIIRRVQVEHDTIDPLTPGSNVLQLKIGDSHLVSDPLSTNGKCSVLWHELEDKPLACPNPDTNEKMLADGTRPDDATEWFAAEQGIYLYYWITIASFTGAAPVGSDTAWSNIAVDYLLLP